MSMLVSRRGFLGTLVAAAVGAAAQFDPLRVLWVPQSDVQPVVIAGLEELNDLALRFAKMMAEQMTRRRVRDVQQSVLASVTYGDTPMVQLRPTLRQDHLGPIVQQLISEQSATTPRLRVNGQHGYFERTRRIAKSAPIRSAAGADDQLYTMANQMLREFHYAHVDMFVPMTTELRPGVPFTDSLVTVVTDPESGLSVRAQRFKPNEGPEMTSMELGAGTWQTRGVARLPLRYSKVEWT